jgi:hypothetical protein
MPSIDSRRRRTTLVALLVAAVALIAFAFMRYTMDASFSVSNPERHARYRSDAILCLWMMAAGALLAVSAIIGLWRSRQRQAST